MTLLLKSAVILDSSQPALHGKRRDILIENGRISRIGARLELPGKGKVIEKDNLHVSKGWFDSSVSFGEPGFEERETLANGLKVAATSGFSGIILNTNTRPVPDSSGDIVYLRDSARKAVTELYPLGTLSQGANGTDLAELYDMKEAGAIGFSDYKSPVESPNLLKLALLYVQNFKGLVWSFPLDMQLGGMGQVHEGEVSVRLGLKGIPALAETLRISRDLDILAYTGGRLHIPTISTAESVERIRSAKKQGLDVSCSVAIHNLFCNDRELEGFDSAFKVLPPLRTDEDRKALLKGLKSGVIDLASSDHSPIDIEEKRLEFDRAAFGTTGLESAFGALRQLCSAEECVEILSRGRKRFGLPEPEIKEGERAVLTAFDPDKEYTLETQDLKSTSRNCLFSGKVLKGRAYGVVVGSKSNL